MHMGVDSQTAYAEDISFLEHQKKQNYNDKFKRTSG